MFGNLARLAVTGATVVVALLAASGLATADEPDEPGDIELVPSNYLCLACHSQAGISTPSIVGAGHELQAVAPDAYFTSAHGEMACVECHEGQTALPHQKFSDSGEPLALTDTAGLCQSCHGGAAEEFLDSVHGTVIRLGDERAPGCTDCHSAHAVQPITTWSAGEKAMACAKCHDGADAAFAGSLTHVEPTVDRLPIDFIATRFFGALVVAVVGIGILHVELDMLRWLKDKLTRRSREGK